jgi:hypothetical protein
MDEAIHFIHERNELAGFKAISRTQIRRDDLPGIEDRMTPIQYKAAIKAISLSQERAGDWLGIGKRTSQGYALGEYPVPEPVAKLLRLMVRLKLKPEDVA